jgi:hypothetical protein
MPISLCKRPSVILRKLKDNPQAVRHNSYKSISGNYIRWDKAWSVKKGKHKKKAIEEGRPGHSLKRPNPKPDPDSDLISYRMTRDLIEPGEAGYRFPA